MSILPNTSRNIQLWIRNPRHSTLNRPPSRPPATERARHVPIRQLPLQHHRPPLPIRCIPAIKHRPIQSIDIRIRTSHRRINTCADRLAGEL